MIFALEYMVNGSIWINGNSIYRFFQEPYGQTKEGGVGCLGEAFQSLCNSFYDAMYFIVAFLRKLNDSSILST